MIWASMDWQQWKTEKESSRNAYQMEANNKAFLLEPLYYGKGKPSKFFCKWNSIFQTKMTFHVDGLYFDTYIQIPTLLVNNQYTLLSTIYLFNQFNHNIKLTSTLVKICSHFSQQNMLPLSSLFIFLS